MKKIFVFPYNMGSESTKLLARSVGAKRVYPDRNYRPKEGDIIINWGNSKEPQWFNTDVRMLNKPYNASLAVNKIKTLRELREHGVPTVEWTQDRITANDWENVVVRHTVTGKEGAGIEVFTEFKELPLAPLYTKLVKTQFEYRVHVFDGKVIDVIQKRKRNGIDALESPIRNHQNGYVFCRQGVDCPQGVKDVAVRAVNALGLDFGAVDIIGRMNPRVLEVNSAPGISGTTLQKYIEAIKTL